MAFSDEIQKVASERFVLARLEPGRYINDDMVLGASNTYTVNLPGFVVSRLARNGTNLTKVTTPNSDGQYSFDESTGVLTIYTTSAPSSTIIFVVYYYLFYTTDYDRVYPEDVTSGTSRSWQGRILTAPAVSQSVTNIINIGEITSSTSDLQIANSDADFQKYLTNNDSFANKNADSWIVVNNQIQKVFSGKVLGIDVNTSNVSFKLNDSFSILLSEPAYLGEDYDNLYLTYNTYPDARQSDIGKPIPIIYGRTNQHNFIKKLDPYTTLAAGFQTYLNKSSLYRGLSTNSANTSFVLCRIPDSVSLFSKNFDSSNFPQTVAVTRLLRDGTTQTHLASNPYSFYSNNRSILLTGIDEDIEIGDCISYVSGGTTYYGVIVKVIYNSSPDETEVFFLSYDTNDTGFQSNRTITSAGIIAKPNIVVWNTNPETPALDVPKDLECWQLTPEIDYTTTITNRNNCKEISITLIGGWQNRAAHVGNRSLRQMGTNEQITWAWRANNSEPNLEVVYKIHTDDAISNHADTLQHICESSGLTINSSSFSSAKSSFQSDVQFSIPFHDETEYSNLQTYISRLIRSTLGVLFINQNDEVVYKLITSPTNGLEISENEFIGTLSISLDYRDIKSKINFVNQHIPAYGLWSTYDSDEVTESQICKYLHGTEGTEIINHVLRNITKDNRHLSRLDLTKNRTVSYEFRTTSLNLDSEILDNITINDKHILGGSNTVNCIVSSYTKDNETVSITVSDLLGL